MAEQHRQDEPVDTLCAQLVAIQEYRLQDLQRRSTHRTKYKLLGQVSVYANLPMSPIVAGVTASSCKRWPLVHIHAPAFQHLAADNLLQPCTHLKHAPAQATWPISSQPTPATAPTIHSISLELGPRPSLGPLLSSSTSRHTLLPPSPLDPHSPCPAPHLIGMRRTLPTPRRWA